MKDMKVRHLPGDARHEAAGVCMRTNTHLPSHQSLLLQVSAHPRVLPQSGSLRSALAPIPRFFLLKSPRILYIHLC